MVAFAQESESELTRPKGFYASGLYSTLSDLIIRGPSESGEVTVPPSKGTVGFNVSYMYLDDDWGGGLRIVSWDAQFNLFQAPLTRGAQGHVAYRDPFISVFFFDLQRHALPWKIPLGFYGVLGLGSNPESYTISGVNGHLRIPVQRWGRYSTLLLEVHLPANRAAVDSWRENL